MLTPQEYRVWLESSKLANECELKTNAADFVGERPA